MNHFICPVCGEFLTKQPKTYVCPTGHSFDIAKSGYVNLLLSQKSAKKRHGDDKLMVRARTEFLEKGYYECLLQAILKECDKIDPTDVHIADIGCGEGWYSDRIYKHLTSQGKTVQMEGIDISKDALIYAAKRSADIALAAASISRLPIASESVDILVNLFAPLDEVEFHRVLKPGGILLRAMPLEKHLFGLKERIYDTPIPNKAVIPSPAGFTPPETIEIRQTMRVENAGDIQSLFKMTPYYYKTGASDQAKIEGISYLETPIEFALSVYRRI